MEFSYPKTFNLEAKETGSKRRSGYDIRRIEMAALPDRFEASRLVTRLVEENAEQRLLMLTEEQPAFAVERLEGLGLTPTSRHAKVMEASVTWNYTTYLNIVFLVLAAALVWRFVRTGGLPMLKMMNKPMDNGHDHAAHGHAH